MTKNEGILLGIDFGEKNIGLAFGRSGLTFPLKVISGKNIDTAFNDINKVVLENRVTKIVVGLPLNNEGKEGEKAREVRRFAKILKARLKRTVELVDEYESSKEALEGAVKMGIPQKKRRVIDHLSAELILKRYYEKS